jgi:hypothetical protein
MKKVATIGLDIAKSTCQTERFGTVHYRQASGRGNARAPNCRRRSSRRCCETVRQGALVDKHVRGWEKTSDHATVWVELDRTKGRTD